MAVESDMSVWFARCHIHPVRSHIHIRPSAFALPPPSSIILSHVHLVQLGSSATSNLLCPELDELLLEVVELLLELLLVLAPERLSLDLSGRLRATLASRAHGTELPNEQSGTAHHCAGLCG